MQDRRIMQRHFSITGRVTYISVKEAALILLQTVPTHIRVKDIKDKLENVSEMSSNT